jgi:hypothetical protein
VQCGQRLAATEIGVTHSGNSLPWTVNDLLSNESMKIEISGATTLVTNASTRHRR